MSALQGGIDCDLSMENALKNQDPRRCRARRCAASLGWLLSAVAWAGPQAPEAYDLRPLLSASVADDMQACVGPSMALRGVHEFLAKALANAELDGGAAAQLGHDKSPGVVLAVAGRWACVPMSGEGFPMWPVETLHGLIVPVGVPASITLAWRRDLLEQVARDGVGRGLIVYPSGDADQVHVIAEKRQAMQVKFSTRLLRAGGFKESHYPAVLRHPGLTRLVTRSTGDNQGTPSRLAIPPQRLLRQVRDDYVVVEPTAPTRDFGFAGTRWVVPGTPGQMLLRADGAVVHADGARTEPGTWRVESGVLRVALADGARYALTLQADRYTLSGFARRVEPEGHEDEGGEWQWRTVLRMDGAPDDAGAGTQRQAGAAGPGCTLAG